MVSNSNFMSAYVGNGDYRVTLCLNDPSFVCNLLEGRVVVVGNWGFEGLISPSLSRGNYYVTSKLCLHISLDDFWNLGYYIMYCWLISCLFW